MTAQEFITTRKGSRRVMSIAREMNRAHHIAMRQCIEQARLDVSEWFETFSPSNIKACAQK